MVTAGSNDGSGAMLPADFPPKAPPALDEFKLALCRVKDQLQLKKHAMKEERFYSSSGISCSKRGNTLQQLLLHLVHQGRNNWFGAFGEL